MSKHLPRLLKIISHFLFWGFNVPLIITVLNLLITASSQLSRNNQSITSLLRESTQFIPLDILVTVIIVFAMPLLSVIGVIATKSYRQPIKLLQILFGVELPIIAFVLGRLVFLKSLTPINILFLGTATISIIAYLIYIFKKPFHNKFLLTLQLLVHQSAVIVGTYASLLMFFFLPIVIVSIIPSFFNNGMFNFSYYRSFWDMVTNILWTISYSLIFISIVSIPFIGLFVYWRSTNRLSKLLEHQTSSKFSRLSKLVFGLVYSLTIFCLAFQGSLVWFYSQANQYRSTISFEERSHIASQILKQEKFVKNRLIDTYLAHYLYLTDNQMVFVQQAYQDQVKLNEPAAKSIQNWFTIAAFPFVYNGNFDNDVKKAGEYYQDFFDEPIQLAESQKVSSILNSSFNFSTDQLKSSVLDRQDKDVSLVKRIVSTEPDSTHQFATVTIEEEYENTTNSEQEVLYIFSLPQDSVMTDLKLGADLEIGREQSKIIPTPLKVTPVSSPNTLVIPKPTIHQDQGTIAPKGAANQTFENQYRRRIDPAILEQVGPVQYKLRIYPIPVKEENLGSWQRERLVEPVKNQKVRYSYVTALNSQGQASLPKFTETRNIFNGPGVKDMDSSIKVANSNPYPLQLTNGDWKTFYIPSTMKTPIHNLEVGQIPRNTRIALLIDSSYSTGINNWKSYLEKELPLDELLKYNIVDLYYFNDLTSQSINLNQQINNPKVWDQLAFGKTNRLQALKQVEGKYDLTLMFTDGSEADNPGDSKLIPSLGQPVYIIHKDGIIPKLPDNLTYYLQVNSGRAVDSAKEALREFVKYQWLKANNQQAFILTTESGTWVTLKNNESFVFKDLLWRQLTVDEPAGKLAMHRQIEAQMKDGVDKLNDPVFLDELNRTAQTSGIVTPFSSFIVLVTAEQKEQLKQLSLGDSRYLVNYDLGEEPLIDPSTGGLMGTSAVPEPHEWILILTGFGLISYLGRHKVQALLVNRRV